MKKVLIAIAVLIAVIIVISAVGRYNKNQLLSEPFTYFYAAGDPEDDQPPVTALYIYGPNDTQPRKINIDGYKKLGAPYLIKKDDYFCGAERISDGAYCLLHVQNNSVVWTEEIAVMPEYMAVTNDLKVYFTAKNVLYCVDPTKEETEVISEGIEDFITGNLYTDGERILYPKKDMQTSYEKIFSWYLYDPKTSEERFIIDNVDCAGFTKDGDIVVTFPRKFGFRFLKKINVDTFEEEFFIPFMLFHHPVLLDDEYVFYVSDWFDDVWFDYYIFSAKRYASVSLYHLCELSPTYLSTIYRIFIYR